MDINMKDCFRTKDLGEASLLYSSDKRLIHLNHDGIRYWFIFEDQESCQKIVQSFWRKEAMINAKNFVDAERTLKNLIFKKQDGQNAIFIQHES